MWDVWFHGQIVYSSIEHLSNINEIIFLLYFLGLKRPKRLKKGLMKRRLHCLKVILWSIKEKWRKRKGFIKPGKPCLPLWNRRNKMKRRSRPGKYCKIHNIRYGPSKSVIFSFTCNCNNRFFLGATLVACNFRNYGWIGCAI